MIDNYENNNYRENAKYIDVEECQNHTIHRNIDPNNTDELGSSCDVDWIRLNIQSDGFYKINTNPSQGNNNIDTKISLYTKYGNLPENLLATNDDKDPNTIYSEITHYMQNVNSFNDYWVKIEFNYSNSMVGDYEVCLDHHFEPSAPIRQTSFDHNVFTLSPNPTTPFGGFDISMGGVVQLYEVYVYNTLGIVKYHEVFPTPVSSHHVATSSFDIGTYYVYVYNGTGWYGKIVQVN